MFYGFMKQGPQVVSIYITLTEASSQHARASKLKGLSHWRRRRVAATDQLRQLGRLGRPKNGLRSHQGDVAATAETDQSRRLGRPKHGLR